MASENQCPSSWQTIDSHIPLTECLGSLIPPWRTTSNERIVTEQLSH
jgi:hypothetical protein